MLSCVIIIRTSLLVNGALPGAVRTSKTAGNRAGTNLVASPTTEAPVEPPEPPVFAVDITETCHGDPASKIPSYSLYLTNKPFLTLLNRLYL